MQAHPFAISWRCVLGTSNTSPYCSILTIFAFSPEMADQMLDRIELVFSCLKEFNLKIKPKKSYFFQTSITFLGHILSADGLSPNPEKVAKIKDWPIPKTPKEVHSFVGLASYYCRFIPNFCKMGWTTSRPNRPCFF